MKKKVTFIATAAILSSAFATTASADTHTVQKGDTLLHIARTYSTSVPEIKSLNNLKSDTIYVNQKLTVTGVPKTTVPSTPKVEQPVSTPAVNTYTIVKGDTLSTIADKHKLSVANIKAWNNLTSDTIYPGQKLIVTNEAKGSHPALAPVQTPAPSPGSAPQTDTPNTNGTATVYTIKPGDTLGKIASEFKMTVEQLKSVNQLTSDTIYAGKTLNVSVQSQTLTPITPAPIVSSGVDKVLVEAKALVGKPYTFGGADLSGFDCSGFLYYVYNKAGYEMKRLSSDGYFNRSYYVDKPQPGDLVFFANTYKQGISHLGIYLGNNEFIHADDLGVRITSLDDAYYKKHFDSFKRFY